MIESIKDLCRERLQERAENFRDACVELVASYLKHVLFAGNFVPVADIEFVTCLIPDRSKFDVTIYADETKQHAVKARLGYFVDKYARVTAGNPAPGEALDQVWVASRMPGQEFDCVVNAMLVETGWTLDDLT